MAERDPFGRLPDENPLAGLGSLSDETHSQAAQPVVVEAKDDWSGAEPAAQQAKPAAEARPAMWAASSSWRTANPVVDRSLAEVVRQAEAMSGVDVTQSVKVVGRAVKVVVFLVVIGVLASVAVPLIEVGKDVRDAVRDIPAPGESSSPGGGGEQSVPAGLSSSSMLTRRNFDRALARLEASEIGRMRTLTIRPERVDAQLVRKDGGLRFVQIRYDNPEIKAFGAGSGGFTGSETIPFAKIDAGAPARLARSAAGRARLPLSRVDYITLNTRRNSVVWGAYLKGGPIVLANAHGRITRRIS